MAREQYCSACGEQIQGFPTQDPNFVICPLCHNEVPADYTPAYSDKYWPKETKEEPQIWGNLFDGA